MIKQWVVRQHCMLYCFARIIMCVSPTWLACSADRGEECPTGVGTSHGADVSYRLQRQGYLGVLQGASFPAALCLSYRVVRVLHGCACSTELYTCYTVRAPTARADCRTSVSWTSCFWRGARPPRGRRPAGSRRCWADSRRAGPGRARAAGSAAESAAGCRRAARPRGGWGRPTLRCTYTSSGPP